MSLQLIIGRDAAEHSNTLVKKMVEESIFHDADRFFVIVPEQATLKMQKEVVKNHPAHAVMNIDVVSFDRLAHVIFSELGIDAGNCLDDIGKVLVLKKVLKDCKDDLIVYKNKTHMQGFVDEIKSIITELKQYSIDDNILFLMQESAREKGNNLLDKKLQDVRLILNKFNEEIKGTYSTSEEILDIFARVIHSSKKIKDAHIYLDGFTGFTPIQYKLLLSMLKISKDVTVSLTLPETEINDHSEDFDLFHLSNQTYFRLKETAAEAGTDILEDIVAAHYEKKEPEKYLYAASDLKEEVTFVAKEIMRLVREENMRFRDIAVVTSDMESYYSLIRDIFGEAEISGFIDYKSKVTDNQLARFIMAAIGLAEERMSYDSVFSLLKTHLTDLSKNEIGLLENYCLEFGMKGPKAFFNEFTKNKEVNNSPEWNLDEMNHIRKKVEELIKDYYYVARKKNPSAAELVSALKKLCEKARVDENIKNISEKMAEEGMLSLAKEYEQIYELILELLDKVAALLEEEIIDIKDFREVVESGIKEIKISIIPPSLDATVVGDLTRTRLDNIKALFLIGVNEGKIPMVSENTGIFTQKERQLLKENFEIAPTVEEDLYTQRFYLYLALNKPEEKLYLTYACSQATGEQLNASYLIEDLADFVGNGELIKLEKTPDYIWQKEALHQVAKELMEYSAGLSDISDETKRLFRYFSRNNPSVIGQIIRGAFFTNRQTPLDSQVALDLYGEKLFGSVSRYEKFNECAYKHFLNYGLRISPRPEYEVEATDIGSLYHDALEKYGTTLQKCGLKFETVSDDESHRIANECVDIALQSMGSDILSSTTRMQFLAERIRQVTVKTTDVLRQQVKAGLFEPSKFEFSFTEELTENVNFTGKIDRVDIYDADDIFVKIIDYKSGSKKFSVNDIYSGLQLQLVAYMNEAVKQAQKEHPDKRVKPGGVYYYLINDTFVKDEEKKDDRFKMSGLTSCEEGCVEAIDSSLGKNGNTASKIIEVAYKQDGDFKSGSNIANNEEFWHLLDFVNQKIIDVSKKIKAGCVDIEPYYEGNKNNACTYCDYKDVCKFEAGRFGTDWKEPVNLTKEEIEGTLYGRI